MSSRRDADTQRERLDEVTGAIVDEAVRLHRDLGPGLLESVYEAILEKMLIGRGLSVERQKRVVFEYSGIHFDEGLRIDLLVEGSVVVELKSVEKLAPVHAKQVLTYLKLLDLPVGLLINFGGATLKEGLVASSITIRTSSAHAETTHLAGRSLTSAIFADAALTSNRQSLQVA